MKTRLWMVLFSVLLSIMSGCEKNGCFVPKDSSGGDEEETVEISLIGLDPLEINMVSPRTVIEMGGYTCMEINDPADNTQISMVILDKQNGLAALISLAENSVVLYDLDIETMNLSNQFVLMTKDKLIQGSINWDSGEYQYESSVDILQDETSRTRSHYEFGDERDLFFKTWDEVMGKGLDALDKCVSQKSSSKIILRIWKNLPIIMEQLITIDEEELEQVRVTQLKREGTNFIMKLLHTKQTAKLFNVYKSSMELCRSIATGMQESVEEEEVEQSVGVFNRVSSRHVSVYEGLYPVSKAFTLYTSVSSVSKNGASIIGTYKCNDSQGHNIFRKGIRWCRESVDITGAEANSVDSECLQLTGLEEATTYKACSFLTSTSGIFYGEIITFTTKGVRLSLSPNTIELPVEGGTKGILVETNENAEWKVISQPSWCNIERADYSFFVSVGQNQSIEPRSGTITVQSTVTYEDGTEEEPLTATISVTQEGKEEDPVINGSGLDHTKWNVTVAIAEVPLQVSGILEFGDISKGEIYADGMNIFEEHDGEIQMQLKSYTDNKLILVLSLDSEGVHWRTTYTLERFNNQLKGIVEGYMKMDPIEGISYPPVYLSGTMDGTLIK